MFCVLSYVYRKQHKWRVSALADHKGTTVYTFARRWWCAVVAARPTTSAAHNLAPTALDRRGGPRHRLLDHVYADPLLLIFTVLNSSFYYVIIWLENYFICFESNGSEDCFDVKVFLLRRLFTSFILPWHKCRIFFYCHVP